MKMVLEDDDSAVALGGGVGHRLKIAAAALGGRGSRRTCNNGVSVGIGINISKPRAYYYGIGLALARTAREDASDARDIH